MSHDGLPQHPASAQLQALAQAHQQGQLDRAQYRARRRRVLEAARQAQGVTLRNPRSPAAGERPGLPPPVNRFSRFRARAGGMLVLVIAVALILLTFHKCTSGLDRRSVRGERNQVERHGGTTLAACAVKPFGHARQRKFSGVSDVCV
ncbi:hypothetical protein JWH11_09515 [Xanthomonas melonis]|uniref:DUF1707 domain-containing protein n=1 Tax=Xanthomonas melonis TaxID=56456 RepID=A0ABS8NXM8_9XANT|nr:hypothetical protein [Xanthomonas melonis]MCD0266663.1 hypothetical protein [Xanthomonas melonis]